MDVQINGQTSNGQILTFSGLTINSTEVSPANQELNQTFERYDRSMNTWQVHYIDSVPPLPPQCANPPCPLQAIQIDPNFDLYPRMHLFPKILPQTADNSATGSVFYVAYGAASNGYKSYLYNPAVNPPSTGLPPKAAPSVYRKEGTSVLLPLTLDPATGKINSEVRVLALGGCDVTNSPLGGGTANPCGLSTAVNLNTAEVYRTGTSAVPLDRWDAVTGTMSEARQHPNAVLLPDGNVFVSGGEKKSGCNERNDPNIAPQTICPSSNPMAPACIASVRADLFNPTNNTWVNMTQLADMARFRQYHSGAVLLEDGSVLLAGGETDQCCCGANTCTTTSTPNPCATAQIYYPAYLSPLRGTAPGIGMFPSGQNVMNYGLCGMMPCQFTIPMATDGRQVNKVVLIRASAVTHSFNNEQRYIELPIVPNSQTLTSLKVITPADASIAPRGYYMLFVLTGAGSTLMVSDGAWVRFPL